jgi:hypothetical protein
MKHTDPVSVAVCAVLFSGAAFLSVLTVCLVRVVFA